MSKLWIKHSAEYQQQYENDALLPAAPPPPSTATFKPSRFGPISNFITQARLRNVQKKEEDEYKAYCALPPPIDVVDDLFGYWQAQEQAFPKLSKLAYNTLAIPAMSAECERVFSSCKLLITPNRNKLGVDSIEASECLRHGYRNGLID
jgi:hAT family C-terminal dimerisation region